MSVAPGLAMSPWCRPIIVLVLVLSPWAAPTRALALTMAEAEERARTANPDLQVLRARVATARAELHEARLLLPRDPEIELSRGDDGPFAGEGSESSGIALSQELSLANGPRRRAALARLEAREAELADEELQVRARVRTTFFELLGAERRVALAREAAELDLQLQDAAERRYRAGDVSRLEADLASTDVELARAALLALDGERAALARALATLTGMAADGAALSAEGVFPTPPSVDPAALAGAALEARPDLAARRAAEREAAARHDLARRGYLPDPTVRLAMEQERGILAGDDFRGDPAVTGGIDGVDDEDRLLTLSVAFALPVTGRVGAEVATRAAEREERTRESDALRARVAAEVRAAADRVALAAARAAIHRALLPRVEQNLELLRTAYDAGEISLADYVVSRDRAIDARAALVEIQTELATSLVALDLAAGGRTSLLGTGAP